MTFKKTTKRALILSVVSLVICFSMLLGTTFAWFTDSVTSSGNIIKTGTLDVTLEYSKDLPTASGDIKDADAWLDASTGAIFNYDNWEPGYVQVRYVKIENEGTLALKFMLNIIPNEAAGEYDLADVIDVYMIGGAADVTRDMIAAATPVGTLADLIADGDGAAYGTLQAGEYEVYTIVLKMQETAGNEYQNLSVGGGFTVQLLATQLAGPEAEDNGETAETDDLGGDYDEGATYPEVNIGSADKAENEATKVATEQNEVVIDVPANAPAGNYSIEVTEKNETTDASGNTTVSMDITLKKDGAKVTADGTVAYTVSVNIGAGYNLTKVTHNGTEITDYAYDCTTGIITFETADFSPFEFTYDNGKVATDADSLAELVAQGGTVVLGNDITMNQTLVITKDTFIKGDGYTLTYTGSDRAIEVANVADKDIDVTICNLTVECTGSYCQRGINYNENGALVLDNVTVYGNNLTYAVNLPGKSINAKVVINDCDLTGNIALNIWGKNTTVDANNTVFTSVDKSAVEGYAAIVINNDGTTVADNCVLNINGGKIVSYDENGIAGSAISDGTITSKYNINGAEMIGEIDCFVAIVDYGTDNFYSCATLEDAVKKAIADKAKVVLIRDVALEDALVINGDVTIDLNGCVISGICETSQDYLIYVENGATLTVLDSSEEQTGKITFAQGSSNVGWTVDVKGTFNLYSGTVELTGSSWSIGYAVDVRPNAWGTAYTKPTTFNMYGGKVISSDGAIRVASSSSDTYSNVSASFNMRGGEVVAAWDGIFVQQSNATYDVLSVNIVSGKIVSALSPIRVYGPVATSVVGGFDKPMNIVVSEDAELVFDGTIDSSKNWYVEGEILLGGGMTVEALEEYSNIVIK